MNNFPIELLYNFDLVINPHLFMEVLLNNFRNDVTSYQSFIFKFKSQVLKNLTDGLIALQSTDIPNIEEMDLLEQKIEAINDQILRDKLECSNLFDVLNNEKMTPTFLKLAKIKNDAGSLSEIRDDNGQPFYDNKARESYILGHFQKIYGTVHPDISLEDINTFLGPVISNHEIVLGKKLPNELMQSFESDLSLAELDAAIKSAKSNSAGGSDGLNNKVLSKFWALFRQPLYNYAKNIPNMDCLTPTFSSASIKLIPKKGDLSKITNWRPISLLNCIYKVISRAVNSRLQKAAPFILSRAQKGFVKNRYIQECLINVIEKIAFCNNRRIPALVVAIDQSKAFDKVSHKFMTQIYKFFNFGDRFIKIMDGIGTGRNACIVWEDGSRSPPFNLKCGRAQGDGPSPLQYNFAEQLLLLKVELDPEIRPAFELAIEAGTVPAPLPWFALESGKKTNKVEALADDTTVVISCCERSLFKLHSVLVDFEKISGLECNFDKTCIIPIGGIDEIPFNIEHTKLLVSDRVKLLGLNLDKNLTCLETVHENTYEKITKILNFWSRFWLSLPGRIDILKTLCLSQVNYLGCIITPTAQQIQKIEDSMVKFAKGKLNISRDRIFNSPAEGGLGLFDLSSFICAQQTQWVKRALEAACDTWREDLYNLCYGNPVILNPKLLNRDENPILYNISQSFLKFKEKFLVDNDNYKKANLLFNPIMTRDRRDKRPLDPAFFMQNPPVDLKLLAKCSFRDFFGPNPVLLETINGTLNLGLNLNTYLRVTGACSNHVRSLKRDRVTNGTSLSIEDYFGTFKKGSKGIRKYLMGKKTVDQKKLKQVKTFFQLCDIDLHHIACKTITTQLGLWSYTFIRNDLREFIFKLYNNCLGLNVRISHFVDGINRSCTFCSLKGNLNNDETFSHFFLTCDQLVGMRNNFLRQFFGDGLVNPTTKKLLWLGIPPENIRDKTLASICVLAIQHSIWKFKNKKKMPLERIIIHDLATTLAVLYKLDKKLFSNDYNFPLSRDISTFLSNSLH
jgi:hypothetical protein